jgi:hypothetical protein
LRTSTSKWSGASTIPRRQHRRASLTGFDYSTSAMCSAGLENTGVTFSPRKELDPISMPATNQPLAAQGVPAHTICVAFSPDYHGARDTAEDRL